MYISHSWLSCIDIPKLVSDWENNQKSQGFHHHLDKPISSIYSKQVRCQWTDTYFEDI